MKCGHEVCTCTETPVTSGGQEYCSEDCANDARNNDPECHCGHMDCGGMGGAQTPAE